MVPLQGHERLPAREMGERVPRIELRRLLERGERLLPSLGEGAGRARLVQARRFLVPGLESGDGQSSVWAWIVTGAQTTPARTTKSRIRFRRMGASPGYSRL